MGTAETGASSPLGFVSQVTFEAPEGKGSIYYVIGYFCYCLQVDIKVSYGFKLFIEHLN